MNYKDRSCPYLREVSLFATPEHGIINLTTNDNGSAVDFDFFEIWKYIKESKVKPSRIQMFHSHPPSVRSMSTIDYNMLSGWRIAMGVPVYFYVITPDRISSYICDKKDGEKPHLENCMGGNFEAYGRLIDLVSQIIYGISSTKDLTDSDICEIKEELMKSKWSL